MLTQPPEETYFLSDFLTFLRYVQTHQIRVTTLKSHIPLRHLRDLSVLLRGKEPFHPLHSDTSYEMRCQRDQRRIDFMDTLAMHMGVIERSEWGYIAPGAAWKSFAEYDQVRQREKIWQAFWSMDWSGLYPWTEVVDMLEIHRPYLINDVLVHCAPGQKIPLNELPQERGLFSDERAQQGFFWTVIRPLEFMDFAKGYFEKDAQGFWFPEAFEMLEIQGHDPNLKY